MTQQEAKQSLQKQVEALQQKCTELENRQDTSTNPLMNVVKPIVKGTGVIVGVLGGAIAGEEDPTKVGHELANEMGKLVDKVFK